MKKCGLAQFYRPSHYFHFCDVLTIGFRPREYNFWHPETFLDGITVLVFGKMDPGVKIRPIATD